MIAFATGEAPKGFDVSQEHHVKVEVRGNTYRAYVNGKEVVSGTNDRFSTGAIGLYSKNKSVTDFDDVNVVQR